MNQLAEVRKTLSLDFHIFHIEKPGVLARYLP